MDWCGESFERPGMSAFFVPSKHGNLTFIPQLKESLSLSDSAFPTSTYTYRCHIPHILFAGDSGETQHRAFPWFCGVSVRRCERS